mmetsp:Transcript_104714/g.165285  ORF Transcript_104714/g.165285 Transcript_104714/m.165285 type:complete len:437 (-) Transcript_104714:59-1369(-)
MEAIWSEEIALPPPRCAGERTLMKTKMCKFIEFGKCLKGKQCLFAHSTSELEARFESERSLQQIADTTILIPRMSSHAQEKVLVRFTEPDSCKSFVTEDSKWELETDLMTDVGDDDLESFSVPSRQTSCFSDLGAMSRQVSLSLVSLPEVSDDDLDLRSLDPPSRQTSSGISDLEMTSRQISSSLMSLPEVSDEDGDDDLESFGTNRQTSLGLSDLERTCRQTSVSLTSLVEVSDEEGVPRIGSGSEALHEQENMLNDVLENAKSLAPIEKLPKVRFRKTKQCKFFQSGTCKRGDNCNYAHTENILQPLPDLYRTRLCVTFDRSGQCKDGDRCKYAHGAAQLRTSESFASEKASSATSIGTQSSRSDGPLNKTYSSEARTELQTMALSLDNRIATHFPGLHVRVRNSFLEFYAYEAVHDTSRRSASCENLMHGLAC